MLGVDDMPVILVIERMLSKHTAGLLLDETQQLVVHARIDQQVVGRHAGLPHVEPFTKGDTACRDLQVSRRIHDAGTLSAQLKRHGCEVFTCTLHDELADRNATGKEDLVPALIEQRFVFGTPAFDDRHQARIKCLFTDLLEHRARCRSIGTRLDNHGVTRGERAGERLERQQKRVVPRSHDERDAIGHGLRFAHAHGVSEVARTQARTTPSRHMSDLMSNLGKRRADLAHIGLVMRLPQIGLERMGDIGLVGPHRIA